MVQDLHSWRQGSPTLDRNRVGSRLMQRSRGASSDSDSGRYLRTATPMVVGMRRPGSSPIRQTRRTLSPVFAECLTDAGPFSPAVSDRACGMSFSGREAQSIIASPTNCRPVDPSVARWARPDEELDQRKDFARTGPWVTGDGESLVKLAVIFPGDNQGCEPPRAGWLQIRDFQAGRDVTHCASDAGCLLCVSVLFGCCL